MTDKICAEDKPNRFFSLSLKNSRQKRIVEYPDIYAKVTTPLESVFLDNFIRPANSRKFAALSYS